MFINCFVGILSVPGHQGDQSKKYIYEVFLYGIQANSNAFTDFSDLYQRLNLDSDA